MNEKPLMIDKNFVVLSPDKTAVIEDSDATLYERLETNYGDFKNHELISCYEFDSDWPTWEVHPFGDEVVMCSPEKRRLSSVKIPANQASFWKKKASFW